MCILPPFFCGTFTVFILMKVNYNNYFTIIIHKRSWSTFSLRLMNQKMKKSLLLTIRLMNLKDYMLHGEENDKEIKYFSRNPKESLKDLIHLTEFLSQSITTV